MHGAADPSTQTPSGGSAVPSSGPSSAPADAAPATGRVRALVRTLWTLAKGEPLIPFAIAGAAIFAAYFVVEKTGRGDPIRYTPEIARQQVADFEAVSGRKATAADRARMRDDYISDELLFREAIDRGLYLTDPETRARLIDKQRYMVAGAPVEPTEEQMIDFYAAHPDLYRSEPGISFSHIFFAEQPKNPQAILARLNAGGTVAGDDFWMGRDFPRYGLSMIRGMFGQSFLAGLEKAANGRWYGPVRSPRGWHFVRKTGTQAPARIPYAQARGQVRQDMMQAGTKAAMDREIGKLKEKYDVEITG